MHGKYTVLLVEDQSADVLLTQRAFQRVNASINLQIAEDGLEAIHYLSGEDKYGDRKLHPLPQLILLDLKLPRRSGFEVLQWLQSHERLRRIPVIIVSSSDIQRDINQAYDFGANAYLVKPVNFADLIKTLGAVAEFFLLHAAKAEVN